jgi:hypothetical protein
MRVDLPQDSSATSLPAAIRALSSPLGSYLETDLATDLYSGSIPITNKDESDRWISFNDLKKFTTSLPAVIEELGSPLGPRPEIDLIIDLYSGSTPIVCYIESDHLVNIEFHQTTSQP